MTRAARHPGIVPTTRSVPFRIASPAVGSAMTATAQPAQYGFIQPSCIAMPKTAANARPVLMASLRIVVLLMCASACRYSSLRLRLVSWAVTLVMNATKTPTPRTM